MPAMLPERFTEPFGRPPEIKRTRNATVVIKAGPSVSPHALEPGASRMDHLEIPVRKPSPPMTYAATCC
jgi:hypothetical protein